MTVSTVKEQRKNMGKPKSPSVSKSTSVASSNINNDDNDDYLEEGGSYLGDIYIPPAFVPVCSMESNGPRMIISKIIIENFKSYHGVQTIRDLHQNFTAVIGPNGSGKSNIIDAMLFVFGYRASNMRTKKVSSLIHNSSRYQKLNSCSVSVIFQSILDKDVDFETIGEEIVVKRTAYKDNSSFYCVNEKRTTFKDIAKLLSGYGIDLNSNRFLILQGEVEQISLMKPKAQTEHDRGMLEYLEDIIGTTRYKVPLEKITAKVEVMNEEHQHKLNRIKLLERELKDLEGPRNIAVEHLKQKNELVRIENQKYQYYKMSAEKDLEKLNAVKTELDEKLKTTETSIKDIENEKAKREKEIKSVSKALNDLKKEHEHTTALFEAANTKDLALQTEMKQINQNRKKFHELLSKEKVHLEQLEQIPEKNSKLIEECNSQLKKLEHEKETHESHYQKSKSQFEKQNQGFAEERNKISSKLIPLKKTEAELLSVLNMEKAKLNLLQSDENKQKSTLDSLRTKLEQISLDKETKSNELNNLLKSKPTWESNMKSAQEELNKLKSREADIVPRIYSITSQLSEGRAEMQESNSRGTVVNFLMKKKAQGLLPGLFGRLGDLGAIDDKYNVAISTACGQLDFIVVDNMDTATKALNMLKQDNVGRTTFIALDKQQHLWKSINAKFQSPENAPRLFDLVRVPDERMKPAFYYALRDTLVGTDIDQSMRISYGVKRYRVVSLQGELIETSGTMSGGGSRVTRGRMGSSVVTDTRKSIPAQSTVDFQNLEHMRDQLQKELEENSNRQVELENTVARACKELQTFDMEYKKLSLEVNSLKEQYTMITSKIDEQEKRVGNTHTDKDQVKKLQDEIDKYQNSYEQAVANCKQFEKEVEIVDDKMSELKKNLMDIVEKELKRITKAIEKLSNESSRLKVEINASERNVNKSKTTIEKLESDIKKCEKQILRFKDEGTELEVQAGEFLEKIKELEDSIKESEKNWSSHRSGFSEMDKQISALRSSKIDIEQELANVMKNLKENSANLAHVKSKLSKLKLEDIDFVTDSANNTLTIYSHEELQEMDMKDLDYKAGLISTNLKDAQPNLQAIDEYKNKETQYLTRAKELEALTDQRNEFKNMKDKLNKDRHDNFMTGFKIISLKLKELYQIITMGGDAELDLVDTMLPFAEGVVFNVRPLKKSWKAISDLSGGEKTLASLSLVLALHYYRPSPLYVMDEIDAALDFRNVSIVANYIKDRTKNAQFIIISLRNNMFDLSDRMVCIYKTQDCSKAIVLNNNKLLYNHNVKSSQLPNGD